MPFRNLAHGLLSAVLIFSACGRKAEKEKILARVGDRVITVKDFEYRAELTMRPKYPALRGEALNRALLDNLIAEKLFAAETGGRSALEQSEAFKAFVRGIREQNMREALYHAEGTRKVKLDTNEIKQQYRMAGREYLVAFYSIHKDALARSLQERLILRPDAAGEVFDALGGGQPAPAHEIKWKDPDHDRIHEALFSRPVPVDTVIGPLRLGKDDYILMKVMDWKDQVVLGGEEVRTRWNEVVEQTTQRKARALWGGFLGGLMTGRKIEFNPPVFRKLADLSYQLYTAPNDSARRDIGRNFFGQTGDRTPGDLIGTEETLLKAVFFTFDGKAWTVEDFKRELAAHPLVYRNKAITKQAFDAEFKAAVADFLRDHKLTREAYKRRLEKRPEVRKAEILWKDAMVAGYQRDFILRDLARRHALEGQSGKLKAVYEAYVDSLWAARKDGIWIDTGALAAIQVTQSDMVAMKPGVPYPLAMPGFPMLITKNP